MIKIFPTIQIKELDAYTIENEPIASIDLMERASQALAKAISERWGAETPFTVFAGPGNNGGDALAVSRLLERGYRDNLRSFERYLELYFSKPGLLYAFNTCQFDDYSKYVCGAFSGEEKMAYRTEFFPKHCEAAYALGLNLLK